MTTPVTYRVVLDGEVKETIPLRLNEFMAISYAREHCLPQMLEKYGPDVKLVRCYYDDRDFGLVEWFLLWLCSWAELASGLIGVLTLTLWRPGWNLAMSKRLSRWRHKE